jgi:hypothetical protein
MANDSLLCFVEQVSGSEFLPCHRRHCPGDSDSVVQIERGRLENDGARSEQGGGEARSHGSEGGSEEGSLVG